MRLWDLTDLAADPIVLTGHLDQVTAVAFSPDGSTLASGSWDSRVNRLGRDRPDGRSHSPRGA